MNVSSLEDRKEIVRESNLRECNEGTVDDEVYADDYVLHTPMGDRDQDALTEMIEAIRSGTSDFEFRVDDLFGEGDRVVLRYSMGGTNTGPSFLTDEPTGEPWDGSGISVYRFEDGQVAEQWDNFDYLGVLRQLGLLPSEWDEPSV